MENDPGWRLKNHLNDALYHGGDMALRRSIVEIKSYEEYVTGNLESEREFLIPQFARPSTFMSKTVTDSSTLASKI